MKKQNTTSLQGTCDDSDCTKPPPKLNAIQPSDDDADSTIAFAPEQICHQQSLCTGHATGYNLDHPLSFSWLERKVLLHSPIADAVISQRQRAKFRIVDNLETWNDYFNS